MPIDSKTVINYKDAQMEQDIQTAFLGMFAMPKNENGENLYTPEQFVKHHVKNFIKSVVNGYRERQAMAAVQVNQITEIE